MLVLQAANAYSPRNYSYSPKNDAMGHIVNEIDELFDSTKFCRQNIHAMDESSLDGTVTITNKLEHANNHIIAALQTNQLPA